MQKLTRKQSRYFRLIQNLAKELVYTTSFSLLKPQIWDDLKKKEYRIRLGRFVYRLPKYEWTIKKFEQFNEKLDRNIDFELWTSSNFIKSFLQLRIFLKKSI